MKGQSGFILRHTTGRYLVEEVRSNQGGDFCGETTTRLELGTEDPLRAWMIDTLAGAAYVRRFSTHWYNSDHEQPEHSFEPEELEVVRIDVAVSAEPASFEIPSPRDYMVAKYGPDGQWPDAHHLAYVLDEYDKAEAKGILKRGDYQYSRYALNEYLAWKHKRRKQPK
jgi:hypothetical protein